MRSRTTIGVGIVLAVIMLPLLAAANPDPFIGTIPTSIDFGEVDIGSSAQKGLLVTNFNGHDLIIYSIELNPVGGDFQVNNVPVLPLIIIPQGAHELQVVYTPTVEGDASATLAIASNDPAMPVLTVNIKGVGVSTAVTIEDILAFYDAGVEAGTIEGKGPACSRDAHQKTFKFKLLIAAFFIDKGWMKGACALLWQAYERSDGQDCPKDWIKGPDVDELNAMILQLLSDMGCM